MMCFCDAVFTEIPCFSTTNLATVLCLVVLLQFYLSRLFNLLLCDDCIIDKCCFIVLCIKLIVLHLIICNQLSDHILLDNFLCFKK